MVLERERTDQVIRLFQLRCTHCGYGVSARMAPDRCPMCGAGTWEFEGVRAVARRGHGDDAADAPLRRDYGR